MTIRNQRYRFYARFFGLVWLLTVTVTAALSQEKDSVSTDTFTTPIQDSSAVLDESGEDGEELEDTAKMPEYNYYYNREEWTKDSFRLRQVPDSVIKRLQAEDDFWYANKDFEKRKESAHRNERGLLNWLASQRWYKAVAWIIIIGGFLAVMIWFLASSHIGIFRRKPGTVAEAGSDGMTENIFEIDYHKEIDKAVLSANYRLAVRLMFLRLLKNLSERDIIQYQQGRTNFDYLAQVNNRGYYKEFFRLTRDYEYTWYGEFPLNRELFTTIKNDFENLEKQLQ